MNRLLVAAAPTVVGMVYWATGHIHPAIVFYHVLCAIVVHGRRDRLRGYFHANRTIAFWAVGTTAVIVAFLLVAPLVLDPSPYREVFLRTLMPRHAARLFWIFAAYTMVVHVPLEEIYWRGVVLDPSPASLPAAILGNGAFFYLLHAVPMMMILGPAGLLLAAPAGAAGILWAIVTIRSRSLWPGLVSHWGADGVLLGEMWFFFIR